MGPEVIVTMYAGVCVAEPCLGIVLIGTPFHKNAEMIKVFYMLLVGA